MKEWKQVDIGKLTTMTLVRQVVDAVNILLSELVADGRGAAAFMVLKPFQVGTRFAVAKESNTCPCEFLKENFKSQRY